MLNLKLPPNCLQNIQMIPLQIIHKIYSQIPLSCEGIWTISRLCFRPCKIIPKLHSKLHPNHYTHFNSKHIHIDSKITRNVGVQMTCKCLKKELHSLIQNFIQTLESLNSKCSNDHIEMMSVQFFSHCREDARKPAKSSQCRSANRSVSGIETGMQTLVQTFTEDTRGSRGDGIGHPPYSIESADIYRCLGTESLETLDVRFSLQQDAKMVCRHRPMLHGY